MTTSASVQLNTRIYNNIFNTHNERAYSTEHCATSECNLDAFGTQQLLSASYINTDCEHLK